mmetsp:Transcript_15707/g.29624  ORF Transcript_15707/g.29624 Transcript_15707/m.29624 type:complete len:388 (+) Transcript_15707:189-1352(+)
MSGPSLSESIFGNKRNDSQEKDPSLSSLFGSPTALPEKPNNLNFTEPAKDRQQRERKEEKKRKRKDKEYIKDETSKSDVSPEETSEDAEGPSKIDEVEENTIFVGNLPGDISRKKLASFFKECGKVKSARLRSVAIAGVKVPPEHAGNQNLVKKVSVNTKRILEDAPKQTAQGYVVFESIDAVDKALKMNNTPIPDANGLLFRVDRATPTHDSTRSVFVGNLPYKTDEMTLRTHFKSGCGFEDDVIENVRIIRDPETFQCKGFGYVLLKDKSYVQYALEMNGSEYMKKEIRVLVCGKRFKGNKGAKKQDNEVSGALRRVLKKAKKTTAESLLDSKQKKKRGTKKVGANKAGKAGISKRAATEKKLDKRVKKIQKRVQKGMGKVKKNS